MAQNDLIDAFPATIKESLGDKTEVEFPRLDIDDLTTWATELHGVWKKEQSALIPQGLNGVDRYKILRDISFRKPTVEDLGDMIFTPGGAKEVLVRSLVKSGKSQADAQAIVKKVVPYRIQALAKTVISLYYVMPPTVDLQKIRLILGEDNLSDAQVVTKIEELAIEENDRKKNGGKRSPAEPDAPGVEMGSVPPLAIGAGGMAATGS